MQLPEEVVVALARAWLLLLALLVLSLKGVLAAVASTAVRASLLRLTLGALGLWVRFYTAFLEPDERVIRRADFRRDIVWGRYRRLRRRGYQAPEIAMHLLRAAVRDMPRDLAEAGTSSCTRVWHRFARTLGIFSLPGKGDTTRVTELSDRARLQRALGVLATEHGYYVTTDRDELFCCRTCTWADVPEDAAGAVFWDIQGDGYSFDGDAGYCEDDYSDWLQHTLSLQSDGDARLIVKTLREAGFEVRWNGRRNRAIGLLPSPLHADRNCTSPDCRPRPTLRHPIPPVTGSGSDQRADVKLSPASWAWSTVSGGL